VEVAILLTSEVMTNAVLHAGPHDPDEPIALRVFEQANLIRVEVTDGHPGMPVLGDGAVDKPSGRGLLILDALASKWVATPNGSGKVVWFELQA
jgi:anti-sigma regulatory factor (Ser/Thr protein kinase)